MRDTHELTLKAVTDPHFLTAVYELFFAYCNDADRQLDAVAILYFFGSNDERIAPQVYDLCFNAALKPLSEIPRAKLPTSFLPYLGPPEAQDFPIRALGLHLLLDQAPRLILDGVDLRYTVGYFGPLALQLAQDLATLPPPLQPWRLERWTAYGLDFERAWLHAYMSASALAHSEDHRDQLMAQELNASECRRSAESHYGRADPLRRLDEQDKLDTTLFPKLASSAEDGADKLRSEEALWRLCRYIRLHEPIVRVYGRYPYRNQLLGRESTAEEIEWIKKVDGFGLVDSKVARQIREDVEAGRWTPLRGGRPT